MQVTETLRDGLKRGYEIRVTAEELDAKVLAKLTEAQPSIEMKGFRKGKVPMALLKKQFGPRVMGEAMQESIDGAMNEHFEKTGDRPALQPEVKMTNEDWKEGQDVTVALNYEALPEIPDTDLSGITLEKLVVKAEDGAVTEALEGLAKNAQTFEDRAEGEAAAMGDQVVIDFTGRIDGEAFEGGAAEDFPLQLGSGSFIPGFEEQLVGATADTAVDVSVTFPEDYRAEKLAGKEAVFETQVKAVKAPQEAPIDDELAKKFGAEDLDALKGQITQRLEAEYTQAARTVMKRRLLDTLDELVSFDLPPSLVDAEAQQIAHQLWAEQNQDAQGQERPEITPDEEHVKLGERRVRLGLFLAELGNRQGIEVTETEMGQAVMAQARQYPGQEQQFFEFVKSNPQMQQQLRAPIFEDKVVDFIFELVTLEEREIDKDALKEELEKLEEA